MNLVMIEVFPTDGSPRNTSLYFASGARLLPAVPGLVGFEEAAGAGAGEGFSTFVSLIVEDIILLG
jgi:hypothetical protein